MTRMTDEELDRLAERLWKRLEPLAKAEIERMFTNYMTTRTLLEPELVKRLFKAMEDDMHKFVQQEFDTIRIFDLEALREEIRRVEERLPEEK